MRRERAHALQAVVRNLRAGRPPQQVVATLFVAEFIPSPGFRQLESAILGQGVAEQQVGGERAVYACDSRKRARLMQEAVGSSRVDLQACKLEYSIVSPK